MEIHFADTLLHVTLVKQIKKNFFFFNFRDPSIFFMFPDSKKLETKDDFQNYSKLKTTTPVLLKILIILFKKKLVTKGITRNV